MAIRTEHKAKMRVRKGDSVQVISGKDRGVTGKVILTLPKENRVLVEGVNRIKKHAAFAARNGRQDSGGIVTQEAPVHASNVMRSVARARSSTFRRRCCRAYTDERSGKVRTR